MQHTGPFFISQILQGQRQKQLLRAVLVIYPGCSDYKLFQPRGKVRPADKLQ